MTRGIGSAVRRYEFDVRITGVSFGDADKLAAREVIVHEALAGLVELVPLPAGAKVGVHDDHFHPGMTGTVTVR